MCPFISCRSKEAGAKCIGCPTVISKSMSLWIPNAAEERAAALLTNVFRLQSIQPSGLGQPLEIHLPALTGPLDELVDGVNRLPLVEFRAGRTSKRKAFRGLLMIPHQNGFINVTIFSRDQWFNSCTEVSKGSFKFFWQAWLITGSKPESLYFVVPTSLTFSNCFSFRHQLLYFQGQFP